jgi:hypothetical protein
MPETRTSALLQTSSHVLVVGAGIVYLFGFIIMSVFDASYGIADFSLFRTKVIAVGTLFVFLTALPMVLTFRMFSVFGLTTDRADILPVPISPKNGFLLTLDVALSIPFACVGLATLLLFLFATFPQWWEGWGFGLFVLTAAVTVALGIFAKKWFNAHPFLFVFLSALNTAALFWSLFKYSGRSLFWFVVWLSAVCVVTLQTSLKIRNPDQVRKTEWERLFLTIVPVIFGLYATKVYPNIAHQFGGGAPVPIVLHLAKRLPVFDSDSVPVALIDETEQGYYVVRGSDKALFIARGLVEEVEFLRSGQAAPSAQNPSPITFH